MADIPLTTITGTSAGGIPINGVLPINTEEEVYTDTNNQVWLKSGVIETDTSLYPDASYGPILIATGDVYDISEGSSASGIAVDDTYLYVTDDNTAYIYVYNKSTGSDTGTSYSISTETSFPGGITVDDTYLYVADYFVGSIFLYNKSTGVYTGTSYDTSTESDDPHGIAVDDTYLYVVDASDDAIYLYTTENVTGLGTLCTDSDSGLTIYQRVK